MPLMPSSSQQTAHLPSSILFLIPFTFHPPAGNDAILVQYSVCVCFVEPFNAGLVATYMSLILHMPLASAHRKGMNAFKGITNL